MLLYAASRAQLVHEVIGPALEEGKIVISDRFVDSSIVYQGKLYLASNQGLYTTLPSTELNKEIPMTFVPGTGGQMWSFLNYDGKLFCASDNGVFVIDGDKMEHLDGIKGVRSLVPLNGHPDVLIAGTYGKYSGLHLLKKVAGRWQPAFRA